MVWQRILPLSSKTKRITQKHLKDSNQFTQSQLREIKSLKESNYRKFLQLTCLNLEIFNLIKQFYRENQIILLTNASQKRVMLLLEYYDIAKYFSHIYCNTEGNKFANLVRTFGFEVGSLVVFENEDKEVCNALMAGVLSD